MAEVIKYSNEFLPHMVRLFAPGTQRVDGSLNYFRHLFALHQPGPEKSCLLLKGDNRLLACGWITSLESVQPGLVFLHFAGDSTLTAEDFQLLWEQCVTKAQEITKSPVIRTVVSNNVPKFMEDAGFVVVREQVELHAALGALPPVQDNGFGELSITSLADEPALMSKWIDVFNSGMTVLWDKPLMTKEKLEAMKKAAGLDMASFRLGLANGEPVAALYYSVVDANSGVVRVTAAATPSAKRSKGYGRRMLKEVLTHLESKGYKSALTYTDSMNQATNLLFKMLGFKQVRSIKILEVGNTKSSVITPGPALNQVAATVDRQEKKTSEFGFFPGLHSSFSNKDK